MLREAVPCPQQVPGLWTPCSLPWLTQQQVKERAQLKRPPELYFCVATLPSPSPTVGQCWHSTLGHLHLVMCISSSALSFVMFHQHLPSPPPPFCCSCLYASETLSQRPHPAEETWQLLHYDPELAGYGVVSLSPDQRWLALGSLQGSISIMLLDKNGT